MSELPLDGALPKMVTGGVQRLVRCVVPEVFQNAGLSCRFQPASRLERQRPLGTSTLSIRFQTCSVARHCGSASNGRSLNSPEQLPDLQEEEIDLVWDTENAGGEDATVVIKAGDRVLWREPLFWECWPRFNQVKVILKQKYGRRCRSLTPTDRSHVWLFGDSLSASGKCLFYV